MFSCKPPVAVFCIFTAGPEVVCNYATFLLYVCYVLLVYLKLLNSVDTDQTPPSTVSALVNTVFQHSNSNSLLHRV